MNQLRCIGSRFDVGVRLGVKRDFGGLRRRSAVGALAQQRLVGVLALGGPHVTLTIDHLAARRIDHHLGVVRRVIERRGLVTRLVVVLAAVLAAAFAGGGYGLVHAQLGPN